MFGPISTSYRSACQLATRFRWCITSTPVQHKLEDLGVLLSVVGVAPFQSLAVFRRHIVEPFQLENQHDLANAELKRGLARILQPVFLRRTRNEVLTSRTIPILRLVGPSLAEKGRYEFVSKSIARRVELQRLSTAGGINLLSLFSANVQLRLAASHGTFYTDISHSSSSISESALSSGSQELREAAAGALCLACSACGQMIQASNRPVEKCGHLVCVECIAVLGGASVDTRGRTAWRQTRYSCLLCTSQDTVPLPAKLFPSRDTLPAIGSGKTWPIESSWNKRADGTSSKLDCLIEDVRAEISNGKRSVKRFPINAESCQTRITNNTCSVVYSCWSITLDLVAQQLDLGDIRYHRIDAKSSLSQRRQQAMAFFQDNLAPVLLVTTGTAAYRLDLSSARCVFLVEPQWSLHTEREAIGRVVGLSKPSDSVKVIRYVVKGTVEASWLLARGV